MLSANHCRECLSYNIMGVFSWKHISFLASFYTVSRPTPIKHSFFPASFIDSGQQARCVTPLNEEGLCIGIRKCQQLLQLLVRDSRKPEVVQFLRASACGFENLDPKVCCPGLGGKSSFQWQEWQSAVPVQVVTAQGAYPHDVKQVLHCENTCLDRH